ncbi:MAG: phosphate acyltransferase PlsX [Solirubrobacterales bacterium]
MAAGERPPVALDARGADAGPAVVLEAARIVTAEGIGVKLFGPAGELTSLPGGAELVSTEEWITNEQEPVAAVRGTPKASVVMAAADVAAGSSSALVSAGSTGATMTAALFAMKRLRGVHRPALAAQVPIPGNEGGGFLFLDLGANVEVRPQHLIQFAHLGAAFSQAVLGTPNPRVALLSVGEEPNKGTAGLVEAHEALAADRSIHFTGNVEGADLFEGAADVVVTDGFTGNVALKLMEGTARAVAGGVRRAARSNPLAALGGLMLRPALGGLRRQMDPDETGGAILLGLRSPAVVAHGGSSAEGIANAVRLADNCVRERMVERTAEALRASGVTRADLGAAQPT